MITKYDYAYARKIQLGEDMTPAAEGEEDSEPESKASSDYQMPSLYFTDS
ncbi:MAG TPA: hypothetical protein VFT71_06535 [Candidatus Nitrosocosmicus sp.]|nr:hypothetical protein [Candidatus Nitrosocosmicus sp.]